MRCTPIVAGLVLSSIVFTTVSTQAQVSIDVSKITCDQYVHNKIPTPDFVRWLRLSEQNFRVDKWNLCRG